MNNKLNTEEKATRKTDVSKSFYCKYFTEDEFATNDEKCKNQCEHCKNVC